MSETPGWMSLGEAADLLGIDRRRLRVLIERRGLKLRDDPLDFRKKLISRVDVAALDSELRTVKKAVA